jgi:E3 ubiquitin-protein ligase UBR1
VQIFTTPSISLELVDRYQFLTHLLAIELTYFTAHGRIGRPTDVSAGGTFDGARDQDDANDSWKPDIRIMDIQEDVHHLLGNEAVRRMIPKQQNWLMQFLEFFSLFQGMHVQKRETVQHREYESLGWEVAHHITQPITRLMGYLADGYRFATRDELRWALNVTLQTTLFRCLGSQSQRFPHSDPVYPIQWHQINGVDLVDYKVAEEYVSLYYPLNWMLSLLVSRIVELETVLPVDWNWWLEDQSSTSILACVDYPLRANVFCSQIKAKLWARNGLVMLRQYYAYNITYAHSRACSDFTFLQWGFAILPHETMLLAMIDRYDLVEQLTNINSTRPHPIYQDESLKVMIEEFFQMFLTLMNERNTALGETGENIVRREIAHRLIFKKLPYSDILRQVRQYTEVEVEDHFDKNLTEMAHFHRPTETHSGTYELKTEYYSLIDPRHRSYTRNQAVECERVLTDLMASQGVPEADRVVEPSPRVLQNIRGPFAGLTKVLGTALFAKVVQCGVRLALQNPSETILDQALYLCFIAVMDRDTQHAFVSHAQTKETTLAMSLVEELLVTLRQPRFSTLYPKVRRLLSRMKEIDSTWFDLIANFTLEMSGRNDTIAAAEAQEKKRMARERQMEALNRMKLAQTKFQESHKAFMDDSDSDAFEEINAMDVDDSPSVTTFQFPRGTCILCQEETNDDKAYGLPTMLHQNPVSRFSPLYNDYFLEEVVNTPSSLDTVQQRPFGQGNLHGSRNVVDSENRCKEVSEKILGRGFPFHHCYNRQITATTCGHLLHYRCWLSYHQSVQIRTLSVPRNQPENVEAGEFLCPLCRALSNTIVPVVWNEGQTHQVTGPVFTGLSTVEVSDWLKRDGFKTLELDANRTYSNLLARVDSVLPRLFPSLSMERRSSRDYSFTRQYNLKHDNGRIQMYANLHSHVELRYGPSREHKNTDGEWDSSPAILLAGTITSMEIAQRGTGDGADAELSPRVLGALSSQDLMQLRVLAETVKTRMAFQAKPTEIEAPWKKCFSTHQARMIQTFPCSSDLFDGSKLSSLLNEDIFERFVVSCGLYSHAFGVDMGHLLVIHYVAEVVKITSAVYESLVARQLVMAKSDSLEHGPSMTWFLALVTGTTEMSDRRMDGIYHLLRRYILPFLRKAVIFTHVYEGVVFPKVDGDDTPESDRLCRLLGLPSLVEVIALAGDPACATLTTMIRKWVAWRHRSGYIPIDIHHPAIFEVIGLPTRLDVLLELASKFRCLECGSVPDEPAMCLLCGEIVCTQTVCCEKDGMGEMNLHREM